MRLCYFMLGICSSCTVWGIGMRLCCPTPQHQLGQELEEEVEAMLTAMRRELIRAAEEAEKK